MSYSFLFGWVLLLVCKSTCPGPLARQPKHTDKLQTLKLERVKRRTPPPCHCDIVWTPEPSSQMCAQDISEISGAQIDDTGRIAEGRGGGRPDVEREMKENLFLTNKNAPSAFSAD